LNALLLTAALVTVWPDLSVTPPPSGPLANDEAINARLQQQREQDERHARAVLQARLIVPRSVKQGETVSIVYEIVSVSSDAATVDTGLEQCHRLAVEQRGPDGKWSEIWDNFAEVRARARALGADVVCADVGKIRTIARGRPYKVEVTWKQRDAKGQLVPVGIYRAVSHTGTSNPRLPSPEPSPFEITP
jgi:hypothetical protein